MKDGKYEVGDVIAFRVTANGPKWDGWVITESGNILGPHVGTPISGDGATKTLERIPNPKLMEGEWWNGWTMQVNRPLKKGDIGAYIKGGAIISVAREEAGCDTFAVLIPPPSGPCPELKAKIDKLETELAELRKQALG